MAREAIEAYTLGLIGEGEEIPTEKRDWSGN